MDCCSLKTSWLHLHMTTKTDYPSPKPHIKPKNSVIQQSVHNVLSSMIQGFTFGTGSAVAHKMVAGMFSLSQQPKCDLLALEKLMNKCKEENNGDEYQCKVYIDEYLKCQKST